jgi:ABC-type Mn2+/Zn2+ transport system permease subunit
MLASGEELIEALFGGPNRVGAVEGGLGIAAALLVIAFIWRAKSRLVIALIARDLARTARIDVARLDLLFLLAFAVTVALGLRYLGVLLMGSLIIIPAVTARQIARNLTAMLAGAVALAIAATLAGLFASPLLHVAAGPLTIAIAAGFFLVSLLGAPWLHSKLSGS